MRAFRTFLGTSDMMVYLAMMAPRLVELRRVLKETDSIYLHCDPTASHYLKLLMDAIFGPQHFRSEIIWRRTGSHNEAERWAPIHDTILFYTKTDVYSWNKPKRPYMLGHVLEHFSDDGIGNYQTKYYGNVLTGPGIRNKESGLAWRGVDPSAKKRHWAIPSALLDGYAAETQCMSQHEKLDFLETKGLIKFTEGNYRPVYERIVGENDGPATSDLWTFQPYTEGTVFKSKSGIDVDIRWLSTRDAQRLGYPTQKPEGVLERILHASSNEGDTVLDPFCGCGTTIQVAQRLNRKWIGIDITHLAIGLIKKRLSDAFGVEVKQTYEVIGEPTDFAGAARLAEEDKYQFQWWSLGLVGARPAEQKKGADRGIDGCRYFHDDASGKSKQLLFSVKAGAVQVAQIRDLCGTLEREHAEIGVFLCFEAPTKPMLREAAEAGLYTSSDGSTYPRIQILTIEEILLGSQPSYPLHSRDTTFKKAPKASRKNENLTLPLG